MERKGRKNSKKKEPVVSASPDRKKRQRKKKTPASIEEGTLAKKEIKTTEEIALDGPISGKPSLIQSTYGNVGNFDLVAPLAAGGLAHYWRDNDSEDLAWYGPLNFGPEAGRIDSVSLIQGDFGEQGNLELVAVDFGGHRLMHFWRESGPSFDWHGPNYLSEKPLVPVFSGNPAMIWSNFGCRGNFDVVAPLVSGGFSHYWRDNDDPALPWCGPNDFATSSGIYDAVTMIQSNFGDPGNLEIAARSGDQLAFFWRDSGPDFEWHGPEIIATGVAGTPSMIQSSFGSKGNFELVVPLASGGLGYYWRDNDDPHLHWYGPMMFGMNMGLVDGVSLIQSNFGQPGHLEIVAQVNGQLAFFWRDSGPDFRWNGPQYLKL